MKDKIQEFVHRRNDVSFPELMRAVPDSSGERMLCHENHGNLVLWQGMSEQFLLTERKIHFRRLFGADITLVHAADRGVPDLLVAHKIQDYATEHWLPVVICRD